MDPLAGKQMVLEPWAPGAPNVIHGDRLARNPQRAKARCGMETTHRRNPIAPPARPGAPRRLIPEGPGGKLPCHALDEGFLK